MFSKRLSESPLNEHAYRRGLILKRIYAMQDYCIGCRLCEVHCITQQSKARDIVKSHRKEVPSPSRVRVQEEGSVSFAVQCRHCNEPMCVYSCLSGAMSRDPVTGIVTHDRDRCIGCWTCVMVCPFGAVVPDTKEHKVVSKCDLCTGQETPACVQNCPNRALVFQEVCP